MSEQKDFFISSKDRTKLFYRSYLKNSQENKKNLILVHGALEHSGRYKRIIEKLLAHGFNCYTYDLRGHGNSEGSQGDTPAFEYFTYDLESFVQHLKKKHQLENYILLGHSLGGLITLSYCLKHENKKELQGAYVSAPALSVKLNPIMKMKLFLARNIFIKLFPKLKLPVDLDLNSITHDSLELQKYKEDPLVFNRMSVRQALGILDQGESVIQQASSLKTLPVFLAHGSEDSIAFSKGTEDFFQRVLSPNKKIIIYKGFFHELFNEDKKRRDLVYQDLLNWLNSFVKT